jgi:Cobalamin synthesis protein cobW C-terminal domain
VRFLTLAKILSTFAGFEQIWQRQSSPKNAVRKGRVQTLTDLNSNHSVCSRTTSEPWAASPSEDRRTCMVFITRDLPEEAIEPR